MATYKIKPGDTLADIADRYDTTVADLVKRNNISNPNLIYADTELSVPGDDEDAESPAEVDDETPAPEQPATSPPTSGFDINNLLGLSEVLESTGANISGLGSDLSTIVDPALMASLGELGLSEDLGTLNTLESATRLLLGSGVQRGRLQRGLQREQELTGANLSGRGIHISKDTADGGLVAEVASNLGRRQGEQVADFEADVGDRFRSLISGLGNQALSNVGDIGSELFGAIGRNSQQAVNQIPEVR